MKEWAEDWFYVANHAPALKAKTNLAPKSADYWYETLNPLEMNQVPELLEMIANLKEQGLTGQRVYLSFLMRRV